MATTSAILELILLALGESASGGYLNWGEVTNENITKLEKTVGEVTSKTVTTANITMTDAEHNSLFIKATGALTGNRSIDMQNRKGFWFVSNGCTGDYTLTVKTAAGAGIVVPQGATAILASDGTDVLRIATLPSGGKVPGAATLQSEAAGYTAGVADNGNFFEHTAALTMALKPAALLGADWACVVKATTGTTVIDPDGAELINGAATLSLTAGQAAFLYCTGTAFRAIVLAATIPFTAASASGAASLEFAEDTDNGSSKATLKGAAALAGDVDIVLPAVASTLATLAGTETLDNKTLTDPAIVGAVKEDVYAIVDGAGFEIDPSNGTIQTVTLGANRTPAATNFASGESVTLRIADGSAYAITWTTVGVVWVGGSAPTLATSGYSIVVLWKDGTTIYGKHAGDVAS